MRLKAAFCKVRSRTYGSNKREKVRRKAKARPPRKTQEGIEILVVNETNQNGSVLNWA